MRHSPPHALPHTRYFLPVWLRFYFKERTRDLSGASAPTQPQEAPSGTQKRARQAPTGEGKTENHRGGWAGHFLLPRGVAWFPVALRLSSSAEFSASPRRLPGLRPRPPCSVRVQGFPHQGRLPESLLRGPPAPHSEIHPPVPGIHLCRLNSGDTGAPRGLCRSGHAPSSTCLPGKR